MASSPLTPPPAMSTIYVSSTYQDLVAFVVLALVFTFKPTGLFKESV